MIGVGGGVRHADHGRVVDGVYVIERKWGKIILDPQDAPILEDWVVGGVGRPRVKRVVLYRRRGRGPRGSISLARLLMGIDGETLVPDHINGDPLDNRRSNLRICTRAENSFNRTAIEGRSSIYKGVQRHRNKWVARIRHQTDRHLGVFTDEVAAALAYDRAARALHGEFASLNFAKDGERSAHIVGDRVHGPCAAPKLVDDTT